MTITLVAPGSRSRLRPWMLVSAVWLWPAVLNVVNRVLQVRLQGWESPTPRDLLFVAGDWLLYALLTPLVFWTSQRWPIVRGRVRERVLIHAGWALLCCLLWAMGGKLLELTLFAMMSLDRLRSTVSAAGDGLTATAAANVAGWILITLPFGVVVYATVAGIAHALDAFAMARDRQVQLARLSEQLTGARYAALQAQLNPHFLFNTLNTIAVLVRDGDRTQAVRTVEQLSDVLRRTMRSHRNAEITLDEEMDLVRTYLAIEQTRFSDRLRVTIRIRDVAGTVAVPAFAVQHLVENAVRHGIASRADAGHLDVDVAHEADDIVITVRDDGPGLDPASAVSGHGLDSTRERLRALYDDRASLVVQDAQTGGVVARLIIPYRELSAVTANG